MNWTTQQRRVDQLKGLTFNPRKLSPAGRERLLNSLRKFNLVDIPVLNADDTIISGHQRAALLLAEDRGAEMIDVRMPDRMLTTAEVKEYMLTANTHAGEWDEDLLRQEFDDVDLSAISDDVVHIIQDKPRLALTDPDDVPEPPRVPVTVQGDVWMMGEHRLMCGDSTSGEQVALLMNGERAGLMNTDPPYGVSYANDERPNPGVAKPRVANDELSDSALQTFLEQAFIVSTSQALKKNAAWYLWHAHLTQGYFAAAAAAAAVVLHRQIIWVKPVLLLGRGQYHWKHEPCFMGWVQGHKPPDYGLGKGERTQTTVWEINSVNHAERKEFDHSTPKPVSLFTIPIVKHLKPGEVAYEPFAGSGPQFIAAEQEGRRCFGMELSPVFCDVIVTRWHKFTGLEVVLESTGRTFEQMRQERLGVPA